MSSERVLRGVTTALLVVAIVALLLTGTLATRRTAPETPSTRNLAVVDEAASAEVIDEVTRGLGAILVYDYRRPHRAQRAAADFLTGDASEQYDEIYDAIAAAGPRQRLVHRSTVARVGVQWLGRSSADLLVFLDQETVRTTDGATNRAPAQVRVEAVREDGVWKVSSIALL